jgi:integrase
MTNKIVENSENVKIEFAPWFEAMIDQKAQTTAKVAAPIMDESYCEREHISHESVEPIRSLDDVERIKNYFLTRKGHGNNSIRNYAYFVLSLNIARRAGDILNLHVYDVLNKDGTFKTHVTFEHEQKTGKKSDVLLNSKAVEALTMYFNTLGEYKMSDWLFPKLNDPAEHISVDGMRRMLQRAVKDLGLDIHIGTHSLRKTMPYHVISNSTNTEDEVIISQFLKHNDVKTTYHYIGRSQSEMDAFVEAHGI